MELWRLTSYMTDTVEAPKALDAESLLVGGMALIGVCGFFLGKIRSKASDIHQVSVLKPLLVGILISLGMTLLTQTVGRATYGIVAEDKKPSSRVTRSVGQATVRGFASFKKGKGIVVLVAIFAFLMLIGGGYAFTAVDLPVWGHMIAFTVGVGLTEELCKLVAAGVLMLPALRIFRHRSSLLPFVMAGLAFGVGESLFYFNSYSEGGADVAIYLIRAIWCVTLHVCWTTIVGHLIIDKFKETPELDDFLGEKTLPLLLLLLPAAVLHGIYDAFCVHDMLLGALVVGMISIGWAFDVFTSYAEPVAGVDDSSTEIP
jgi:RsiW-degrading membrane proteinase PrsW (M82 family)